MATQSRASVMIAACLSATFLASCRVSGATPYTVLATSSSSVKVLRGSEPYLDLGIVAWGPNWGWTGWEAKPLSTDGSQVSTTKLDTGATLRLQTKVSQQGSRRVLVETTLASDRDTDLTLVAFTIGPNATAFNGGTATASGGSPIKLPMGIVSIGDSVVSLSLADSSATTTAVTLEPKAKVTADGAIRVILASDHLRAGSPVHQQVSLTLPQDSTVYTDLSKLPLEPGIDKWFPLPAAETGVSGKDEIGLADWLEAPAGKHGRIAAQGDRLVYNGKPIKLWGLNVCYGDCAPPKELADKRADFYARNGINAIRLHKYADGAGWAGIQSENSFAELDAAGLDRMDYFISKLKSRGIYVELSPTFGVKLGRDDLKAVPYASEFGSLGSNPGDRVSTEHGAIFLSKELQDLQMKQMMNLLKHKNPYTGQTYAEDPTVVLIEMFNEDSALFYGTMDRLQKVPTLRKRAAAAFTQWLKKKYGTEQKLLAAWGQDSLNSFGNEGFTGESWDKDSIVPAGNPWFFDPDQLSSSQKPKAKRLLDTMRFLYELQNGFYDRYATTLRGAGYKGEMVASNWIAGRAFSHLYNLHSDSRIGPVDRHNYFGGANGSEIDDNTMLRRPGSGIFSTGMEQVAGRPFGMSEWIHVYPTEWGAEGPAILGAYGLGLQGWDTSFIFENGDRAEFSDRIGRDQWDATAPQVLGLFPAIARQIFRSDVRESDLVIPRNVSLTELQEGKLGFDSKATASGDVKTSDSSTVPIEALAVGKCVVDFTPSPVPTKDFDLRPYTSGNTLQSSTKQLRWTTGTERKSGWFSIDTPGTQAVVGFAEGAKASLTDVEIRPKSAFSAIYISARDQGTTLTSGKRLLITAIARARNTDMKVFGSELISQGKAPILMEPVVADIDLKRKGTPTVYVLDAAGHRTGRTVPVVNGLLKLDTGRDKSCWYLVTYPQ